MEQIVKACKEADLHETVLRMRQGYDTVVGERGALLSGGQRRRLALARALLRSPRILILDEPYEGLDMTTANSINKTILKISPNRTILIVSHHSYHLRGCTRILYLKNGRLAGDRKQTPDIDITRKVKTHG